MCLLSVLYLLFKHFHNNVFDYSWYPARRLTCVWRNEVSNRACIISDSTQSQPSIRWVVETRCANCRKYCKSTVREYSRSSVLQYHTVEHGQHELGRGVSYVDSSDQMRSVVHAMWTTTGCGILFWRTTPPPDSAPGGQHSWRTNLGVHNMTTAGGHYFGEMRIKAG